MVTVVGGCTVDQARDVSSFVVVLCGLGGEGVAMVRPQLVEAAAAWTGDGGRTLVRS